MAGGYQDFPQDPLEQLKQEIAAVKARVAELERPTGTQLANAVAELQAQLSKTNIPVTASNFSTSVTFPVTVSSPIVIPDGCTRCFFIATAVTDAQSAGAFQLDAQVRTPIVSGAVVAAAGSAPFTGSASTVATGALTGLVPGNTVAFTSRTGGVMSGTITTSRTTLSVLAIFQP